MNRNTYDILARLEQAGISRADAFDLRRIAMTLHRWSELECGNDNGYASYCIVRDDETDLPYMEMHPYNGKSYRTKIADRERGALKRLAKIMAKYPSLAYYVQGDPRGAPLYILRPGDIPEGQSADSYYNRGLAVFK